MKDKKETWVPIAWHCPHCGNRSQAQKTAGDTIKAECAGCLTVMVRRRIGRRHTRFDIYAQEGSVTRPYICLLKIESIVV